MDLQLKGRVAIITGPVKGMVAAVTNAFADEGCKLALVGRDTAAIEPLAGKIKARGGEVIVICCDVTDGTQCSAAAQATRTHYGERIDILVNVAGGSGPIGKTGVETSEDEFDDIIALNMHGFHGVQ